ncbi:hypothetical protein [Nonomuraea sp. LPB2021202275-12-8]|uniref:hypothetical protein n=1 Tax=Nonomuraea sp. LPB2021202275-12-8 TaxID=3120159 RepID=UPI00300DB952
MTTYRLGLPSELKRALEYALPRQNGTYSPTVRVTPRDRTGRKCAAWAADHYEVHAFYTTTDLASLDQLEKALSDRPGVYATTQVLRNQDRNEVTNQADPATSASLALHHVVQS